MTRRMFLGKIYRARVTHADLDYEGSLTVDADLMDAVGMIPHEEVHIWNVTRGTRLVTYVLQGPRGSGVIGIGGAAAHHHGPGDRVVLAIFGQMSDDEARVHTPKVVRVDRHNRIVLIEAERLDSQMPRSIT
jgi:aspartate 1-decarboxylase